MSTAKKEPVEYVDDDELDDILDDALADFDKPPVKKSSHSQSCNTPVSSNNGAKNPSKPLDQPANLFNSFFDEEMSAQLSQEWENAMKELSLEDPSLAENIEKLHNVMKTSSGNASTSSGLAGNKTTSENVPSMDDLANCMKEALSSFSEDTSKNEEPMNFFDNLMSSTKSSGDKTSTSRSATGDPDPANSELDEVGMMENLMKTMLSKEMLYPPMKEMCQKFPKWLQDNGEKISKQEKDNYEKQHQCLQTICKEFEFDPSSEKEKNDRFHKIMGLIDSMQNYGSPPADLINSNGSQFPTSGAPDQCSIS